MKLRFLNYSIDIRANRPDRSRAAGRGQAGVLDQYVRTAPSPSNAVDIFRGEWVCKVPPPLDALPAGAAVAYNDGRLVWAIERLGGVQKARVLELGPLEGGHSYMLDRAGAAEVLSIEGNTSAYLRCLVVKELVGMPSVRFQCGDFTQYLESTTSQFDVCVASGVLYHMVQPVQLLQQISSLTSRLALWSHYYDEEMFRVNPLRADAIVEPEWHEHAGFRHRLFRHDYREALALTNFCGGNRPFSNWLMKDDLLGALRHFGFANIDTAFDERDHPNGPAITVAAWK